MNIIKPKRPTDPGWKAGPGGLVSPSPGAEAWYHAAVGLGVISAVEVADGITINEVVPQYHLTISKRTQQGIQRCSAAEALWVLAQFDLIDALEDNHGPVIRSFWRPVADPLAGKDCECKDTEAAIVDGDFEWRPLTQDRADRRP